jgi:hypothetical protein
VPLQELFEEKCVQLDRAVEARRAVEDERLTADAVAEEMATELEETLAHNEYLRADYDKLAAEVLQLRHQKSSGVLTVRSRRPRFCYCSQGQWEGCLHFTALLTTLVPPTREWSNWL